MPGGSQNTVPIPKGSLDPSYYTADRGWVLIGVAIGFTVIELLAFGLRVFARRLRKLSFNGDDVLMSVALIYNLAMNALSIGKPTLYTYFESLMNDN